MQAKFSMQNLSAAPADDTSARAAEFAKMLSNETRFRILCLLGERKMSVGELARELDMSVSAISHQLGKLRAQNFVRFAKDGKTVIYSLFDAHISEILRTIINHINE